MTKQSPNDPCACKRTEAQREEFYTSLIARPMVSLAAAVRLLKAAR